MTESINKTKMLERIEAKADKILVIISPPEIDNEALDEILQSIESPVNKKRLCDYIFAYGQVMYNAGIDVGRSR